MSHKNREELIKSFQTGVDIGGTFWFNINRRTDLLIRYQRDDLRLIAPKYFIEILSQDICGKYALPQVDKGGFFKYMGITMIEGYEEKIILYHVDYTLYKDEDMIREFDLSIFITQHNK